MYAVAFDLVVAETQKHHPKGVTQAYTEIGAVLGRHGFSRVQGSLYVTENEDLANLPRYPGAARQGLVSKVGARYPRLPH